MQVNITNSYQRTTEESFKTSTQIIAIHLSFNFFYFGVFVPLEISALIWRRHHYRRRPTHFDLCSALMVIEQWGFFSVPHLLWQVASVCNGHLIEDLWHSHLLTSVWQKSFHYLFYRLKSVAVGFSLGSITYL